jgi:hypothetical protein
MEAAQKVHNKDRRKKIGTSKVGTFLGTHFAVWKGCYLGATVEQHKVFVTGKMLCGATVTLTFPRTREQKGLKLA